jgi:hypothetical protein
MAGWEHVPEIYTIDYGFNRIFLWKKRGIEWIAVLLTVYMVIILEPFIFLRAFLFP